MWPKPQEQLQREPTEQEPRAGDENQAKPEEEQCQHRLEGWIRLDLERRPGQSGQWEENQVGLCVRGFGKDRGAAV